jgi:putative ABC transport system ATP-binding protein
MTKILQTKNITKTFTMRGIETPVLRGVNLEVEQGEFLILMGRSGAGKSTLLYQLSMLDRPTGGDIILLGHNVNEYNDAERTEFRLNNFGYVFQDYALIPELTAIENVMIPLLMQGMNEVQAREQAMQTLTRLGLHDKADNIPPKLSGGQQQRVSIARAATTSPKILFADEPTANLDSVSAAAVMELIADINKHGTTVIMVTHEESVAELSNRIVYLDDGLIVSERILRSNA